MAGMEPGLRPSNESGVVQSAQAPPQNYRLPVAAGVGIFPPMSITAIVENDTIKLPPGMHLPDGTEVRIETEAPAGRSVAERYATLAGAAEDMPPDLARNLDHYIHGHARKP